MTDATATSAAADRAGSSRVDMAGSGPAASQLRRTGLAFGVLASVQVLMIVTMSMLSACLGSIHTDLGASTPMLALITAAYGMSFSGLLLLGGAVVDSYGGRRVLELGLLIFSGGSLVSALAPVTAVLLGGRFVQGIGAAFAVPAALALVSEVYPNRQRQAAAMAIWGVLSGLGGVFGLLYGGVLGAWLSWRWTFALPIVAALVVLMLGRRVLPVQAARTAGRIDLPGAVAATVALSALSYGLVVAPEQGWTRPQVLACLAVGAVAALGFVGREARASQPLIPPRMLRGGARRLALAGVFLAATAITTVYFMLALYFQRRLGWGELSSALGFLPTGLMLLFSSVVIGRFASRWNPARMLAAGLAVTAIGLWLTGAGLAGSTYQGQLLIGLLIVPIGVALLFAGATMLGMQAAAPDEMGRIGGLVNAAMEAGPTLGQAILVSLATAIAARHGGDGAIGATMHGFSLSLRTAGVVFLVVAVTAAAAWVAQRGANRNPVDRATNNAQ